MINKGVSLHAIEEKLKLDKSMIRKWKNDKEKLRLVKNKDKKYRQIEEEKLKELWLKVRKMIFVILLKKIVKKKTIGTKSEIWYAGKINPKFEEKSLKAKIIWCYRFIKKEGFSIRRVSHIGQYIPEDMNTLKDSFVKEIILKMKKMNIPFDDDYTIINMDENLCYLEMGFDTILEFTGKKNVDILSSGLNRYRVSVILSVVGNGFKLPPLLIFKGEPGKTIEKELRGLPDIRDKSIVYLLSKWLLDHFVYFQRMDKRNIHTL